MSVMVAERAAGTRTGALAVARTVSRDIDFTVAPPGLADLHRFTLAPLDDTGHLFSLRSTESPGVRLFVVPPRAYFPAYEPRLDPSVVESLGVSDTEAVLLVVVHPGREGQPPTANLLAPVALNPRTGSAVQVVLDTDDWPLRAPLVAGDAA